MLGYSYIDILISVVLAFIMLGIGLTLTIQNFKDVLKAPKSLFIGLTSQIIALPIIAFIVTYFSDLPLPVKVGFILLIACPGASTSGFLTYFFNGNVALSVTFTTINSILTLFTIPITVNLALVFFYGRETAIQLPFWETLLQIFLVTLIPAVLGALIRGKYPTFADRVKKPMNYALLVALAAVFFIKFFATEEQGGTGISAAEFWQIFPYGLLINIVSFIWGYYIIFRNNLSNKDSFTIAIESAVHNTTLAFLVAGTLLQNQDMVKPSLVYSLFSFWTAIIFSMIVKKRLNLKTFEGFKN
ncbi:MAG: bile acid:sodium symporter family protein [Prolixibacteraceae bacterium]